MDASSLGRNAFKAVVVIVLVAVGVYVGNSIYGVPTTKPKTP